MNKISDAAKAKACELANAESSGFDPNGNPHGDYEPLDVGHPAEGSLTALARVLQQHSDVAKHVTGVLESAAWPDVPTQARLRSLILPDDPVDPVEVVAIYLEQGQPRATVEGSARRLRAVLERHGLQITAKE